MIKEKGDIKRISPISPRDELRLEALLSETEKLHDVQVQRLINQRQILLLTLASASIAIPFLLTNTINMPVVISAEVLDALAIIYSGIAMNYTNDTYKISLIGKYIEQEINPEVDRIVGENSDVPVPHWARFLASWSTGVIRWPAINMDLLGTLVLLFMPGLFCLVSARYLSQCTNCVSGNMKVPDFLINHSLDLFHIAVAFFIVAVIYQLLEPILWRKFGPSKFDEPKKVDKRGLRTGSK